MVLPHLGSEGLGFGYLGGGHLFLNNTKIVRCHLIALRLGKCIPH
ncbi:uncharacterized protein METZ01_LOCUS309706, partial [marine metagenome]